MSLNHVRSYNQEIRQWLVSVCALAASIPKDELVRRNCPVCGSGESRFYANNDCLDYERCGNCSLIFMNPALRPDAVSSGFEGEDALLMDYFRIISKYRTPPKETPDPRTDNKLKDIYAFRNSGRLLDVGCSVGDFLHKAKHFYEVEGVEVNPNTAQIAAKEFTVHRHVLAELNLEPVYDVVTLHQILYGIPDVVGLLRDIHRVLSKDGLLYVNTPNAHSYAMEFYGGKTNHLYGYTTLNVFNRRSLEELAARTGFEIISYRTEWLDLYLADIQEYYDHPDRFIHKRNCHLPGYEEKVAREDELHRSLYPELGDRGNYLVAVLRKTGEARKGDTRTS